MSLALVNSRARSGVQAPAVRVEVYLAAGLPVLNMVGLPEAAVRESRDQNQKPAASEGAHNRRRDPGLTGAGWTLDEMEWTRASQRQCGGLFRIEAGLRFAHDRFG